MNARFIIAFIALPLAFASGWIASGIWRGRIDDERAGLIDAMYSDLATVGRIATGLREKVDALNAKVGSLAARLGSSESRRRELEEIIVGIGSNNQEARSLNRELRDILIELRKRSGDENKTP